MTREPAYAGIILLCLPAMIDSVDKDGEIHLGCANSIAHLLGEESFNDSFEGDRFGSFIQNCSNPNGEQGKSDYGRQFQKAWVSMQNQVSGIDGEAPTNGLLAFSAEEGGAQIIENG